MLPIRIHVAACCLTWTNVTAWEPAKKQRFFGNRGSLVNKVFSLLYISL
jgi:hypothetical protein